LKCIRGKGIVNSISLSKAKGKFRAQAKLVKQRRGHVVVMAFDEQGQADSYELAASKSASALIKILVNEIGINPHDIIF